MAEGRNESHVLAVDCIYTALLQLMKIKPYKEITITDITNKAGVSRMAYYRNYKDKDDILVKHAEESITELEQRIISKKSLTEEGLLRDFITNMQSDMFVYNIMQAGLFQKMFNLYKEFMVRVYSGIFGWDMEDENIQLLIYRKMGCLFGYMMYMNDRKQKLNTEILIEHLMSLANDGVSEQ